MPKKMAARH